MSAPGASPAALAPAAASAASEPPLMACRELRVGHGGRALLPPISLEVRRGEFWAVVGRNGSGKSTWMRTLLGLQPALGGALERRADLRLAYFPQRMLLDELHPLTAADVVALGVERGWSFLGLPGRARRAAVERALAEVGATDLGRRSFAGLSEGQKQRVLFARLWASDAEVAFLDEPTSALDHVAEREALTLLSRLVRERGTTVLVVSHYLGHAAEHAHRAVFFDPDCQAVVSGAPREVFSHPAFVECYGERTAQEVCNHAHH